MPYDRLGSGRVAFFRKGAGVYVIDVEDRSKEGYLGGNRFTDVSVSPEADRVAFRIQTPYTSFEDATYRDVYAARLDGTGVHQLSAEKGNSEGPPTWSPDGGSVVYAYEDDAGFELHRWTVGAAGLAEVWATFPGVHLATSHLRPMAINRAGAVATAWSWTIAFLGPPEADDLIGYTSDGPVLAPSWAGDGERLAFLEADLLSQGFGEIRVLKLDTRTGAVAVLGALFEAVGSVPLIEDPYSTCWTADDSVIVFTVPVPGGQSIFGVPSEGGEVFRITTATGSMDQDLSCF